MADVKWIKITTDIFDDEKILLIESLPDANAIIVVWFKLLCLAGKQNNSGVFLLNDKIAYTDKMLATIFRMNEATVTMALRVFENFGMVEIIDGVITIPNWGKHQNLEQLESRREYQREYQREYRKKQKQIASSEEERKCLRKDLHEHNVNSPEEEKEEDIDIEIEIEREIKKIDYQQIAEMYNSLCPSLPSVKSVSENRKKAIKARLNSYSMEDFETLFRKAEASDFLKGSNDRNWSASFDWLIKDANMAKVLEGNYDNKEKPLPRSGRREAVPAWMNKPSFTDMESRDIDFDAIEKASMQQLHGVKTAGNNPEIRERAEALRKQLGG